MKVSTLSGTGVCHQKNETRTRAQKKRDYTLHDNRGRHADHSSESTAAGGRMDPRVESILPMTTDDPVEEP